MAWQTTGALLGLFIARGVPAHVRSDHEPEAVAGAGPAAGAAAEAATF